MQSGVGVRSGQCFHSRIRIHGTQRVGPTLRLAQVLLRDILAHKARLTKLRIDPSLLTRRLAHGPIIRQISGTVFLLTRASLPTDDEAPSVGTSVKIWLSSSAKAVEMTGIWSEKTTNAARLTRPAC